MSRHNPRAARLVIGEVHYGCANHNWAEITTVADRWPRYWCTRCKATKEVRTTCVDHDDQEDGQ